MTVPSGAADGSRTCKAMPRLSSQAGDYAPAPRHQNTAALGTAWGQPSQPIEVETSLYSTPRGQLFKQCPPKTPLQQSTGGMKLSLGTGVGTHGQQHPARGRLKTVDSTQPGEKGWTLVPGSSQTSRRSEEAELSPSSSPETRCSLRPSRATCYYAMLDRCPSPGHQSRVQETDTSKPAGRVSKA